MTTVTQQSVVVTNTWEGMLTFNVLPFGTWGLSWVLVGLPATNTSGREILKNWSMPFGSEADGQMATFPLAPLPYTLHDPSFRCVAYPYFVSFERSLGVPAVAEMRKNKTLLRPCCCIFVIGECSGPRRQRCQTTCSKQSNTVALNRQKIDNAPKVVCFPQLLRDS